MSSQPPPQPVVVPPPYIVLRVGDVREATDEYFDGSWKPIPSDRVGLPIFEDGFPHRRRVHDGSVYTVLSDYLCPKCHNFLRHTLAQGIHCTCGWKCSREETPAIVLSKPCPVLTTAKFGYEWITMSGKRAFCWTVTQDSCNGLSLEGVTYNETAGVWDGETNSTATYAVRHPATGPTPNPKQLCEYLARVLANTLTLHFNL